MNATSYSITGALILAMISTLQCIPIEVVYTGGDNCDCPKSLNYLVNVPPPPEPQENPRYEHGYKLEVPPPAKAKVTYSFDFTVQEPQKPVPAEEERWNLYAKVDRITAHKQDCVPTSPERSPSCSCGEKCNCARCRYVSSTLANADIFKRSLQTFKHPNSLKKKSFRGNPFLTWAAIITPVAKNEESTTSNDDITQTKTRRRRDLSKLFGLHNSRKSYEEKRPVVKHYKKRLSSYGSDNDVVRTATTTTTKAPLNLLTSLGESFAPLSKAFPALPTGWNGKGPLVKLRDMMLEHNLRNKRDIKGEYDLLESDRDQLDLTLPEIIQFMPETLDPNFKRGQCQFANCHRQFEDMQQNQQMAGNSLLKTMEGDSSKSSEESTDDHHDGGDSDDGSGDGSIDNNSTDDDDDDDNKIHSDRNSSVRKRNVGPYSCAHYSHFRSPTPPANSYSVQEYEPSSDYQHPSPFGLTNFNSFGQPQQIQYEAAAPHYFANPYSKPAVALSRSLEDEVQVVADPPQYRTYSPAPGYYSNTQLDQIIADIVSQHVAQLEAPKQFIPVPHSSAALTQDNETRSFLKLLSEGKFNKLFGSVDKTYTFPPLNFYTPLAYSNPSGSY
ncbi:chorion protein b at 7F [Musca autumnalis]|uniref:chorion protein b at 7F n=1 Tax=Musca autumnalis TaxID=221902 RepID=UPI003CF62FEA